VTVWGLLGEGLDSNAQRVQVEDMRGRYVLAGIASVGLVAGSLLLAALSSAAPVLVRHDLVGGIAA